MIDYVTLDEVVEAQAAVINANSGTTGVIGFELRQSAVTQPLMTFGSDVLDRLANEKALTLGCSLVSRHSWVDGNRRADHATLASFVLLNGLSVPATVDEQELCILFVATGKPAHNDLPNRLRHSTRPVSP